MDPVVPSLGVDFQFRGDFLLADDRANDDSVRPQLLLVVQEIVDMDGA